MSESVAQLNWSALARAAPTELKQFQFERAASPRRRRADGRRRRQRRVELNINLEASEREQNDQPPRTSSDNTCR